MAQQPESLLSDFLRGDPDRIQIQSRLKDDDPLRFQPPSAMFTRPAMQRDPLLAWEPGKLFLGVMDGKIELDEKNRKFVMGGRAIGVTDDRHICTFAGSRAGKGRAAIIPNILHWPGSVIATDPKGELAVITARRRKEMGQDVHVLDPFGTTARYYPGRNKLLKGFNPIKAMRDDTLVEDAALIADAIVIPGNSKDPHWDDSARALIEGLVLHIRTHPAYRDRQSLLTLRELLGLAGRREAKPDDPPDSLKDEMLDNPAGAGVVQFAAADFFDKPPTERGSVLSNARRQLKFIDLFRATALGRHTLDTHSFDLDYLKTRDTTIYLCLPARHMGTCSRWLRLFVNLTLQSVERTGPLKEGRHAVLCALDEFASLGQMKQLEDAIAQIAGFGAKMWVVLQDMGQLKALYEDRWETFLGNSGILQFFGNNDLTTLQWISKRCGQTSILKTRHSDITPQQRMRTETGEANDSTVHDLLSVDEAASYFGRDDPMLRQLVIWVGWQNPLLVLQRAYYDHHALFKDMRDKPLYDPQPRASS